MAKSKKDVNKKLTDIAIEELKRLLADSDKKIRLRAISLILRHRDRADRSFTDDKFDAYINQTQKELEHLFQKFTLDQS